MKILLTGATGFIGSHLARELVGRGNELYALVRKTSRYQFLSEMGVRLVFGSLETLADEKVTLPPVDAVIHNGGLVKARKIGEFYRVNTEGTRQLVESLRDQNLGNFVFVSSISARGPSRSNNDYDGSGPVSHYGKSKLKAERILKKMNRFPVTIVRPPIVYGPGDEATLPLFKMFKKGFFPVIHGGRGRSSFIYIDDLTKILATLAEKGSTGEGPIYPDDGRGGYSWKEVIAVAQTVFDRKIIKISLPLWVVTLAMAVFQTAGLFSRRASFLTLEKFQEMKQPLWICSNRLLRTLNLPPLTDLKTGLAKTKSWYEKEGWL